LDYQRHLDHGEEAAEPARVDVAAEHQRARRGSSSKHSAATYAEAE
jgi:hypothetical protein